MGGGIPTNWQATQYRRHVQCTRIEMNVTLVLSMRSLDGYQYQSLPDATCEQGPFSHRSVQRQYIGEVLDATSTPCQRPTTQGGLDQRFRAPIMAQHGQRKAARTAHTRTTKEDGVCELYVRVRKLCVGLRALRAGIVRHGPQGMEGMSGWALAVSSSPPSPMPFLSHVLVYVCS